jgi:hypothetical protein
MKARTTKKPAAKKPAAKKTSTTKPSAKEPAAKKTPAKQGITFDAFLRLEPKPTGKHCPALRDRSESLDVPLWLGSHADVIDVVRGFSVRDDCFGLGYRTFVAGFAERFPQYVMFAIVDSDRAEQDDPSFRYDSYLEFFLAVDQTTAERAVHLWTASRRFQPLYPSFAAFWADLS